VTAQQGKLRRVLAILVVGFVTVVVLRLWFRTKAPDAPTESDATPPADSIGRHCFSIPGLRSILPHR